MSTAETSHTNHQVNVISADQKQTKKNGRDVSMLDYDWGPKHKWGTRPERNKKRGPFLFSQQAQRLRARYVGCKLSNTCGSWRACSHIVTRAEAHEFSRQTNQKSFCLPTESRRMKIRLCSQQNTNKSTTGETHAHATEQGNFAQIAIPHKEMRLQRFYRHGSA
jgi:hypothetical protein